MFHNLSLCKTRTGLDVVNNRFECAGNTSRGVEERTDGCMTVYNYSALVVFCYLSASQSVAPQGRRQREEQSLNLDSEPLWGYLHHRAGKTMNTSSTP